MTEATAPTHEQGSDEWRQQRVGKITASRIYDVVGKQKNGQYYAKRANYITELMAERLTGVPQDMGFQSEAILWGLETEARAVASYEWALDLKAEECGFIDHPTIPMSGASPDRLVSDNGLVEVKCLLSKEHVRILEEHFAGKNPIPDEYLAQVDWELACTGRDWCDFVSFDPRMPEYMQLYYQRIYKDAERIQAMEDEVRKANAEIEAKLQWIEETFNRG